MSFTNLKDNKNFVDISRFIPGSHYYVLDKKFLSYEQAEKHALEHGYKIGQYKETRIYGEGD